MIKLVKVPRERSDLRHALAQLLVQHVRAIHCDSRTIRRIGRTLKMDRINDVVLDVLKNY